MPDPRRHSLAKGTNQIQNTKYAMNDVPSQISALSFLPGYQFKFIKFLKHSIHRLGLNEKSNLEDIAPHFVSSSMRIRTRGNILKKDNLSCYLLQKHISRLFSHSGKQRCNTEWRTDYKRGTASDHRTHCD